MKRCAKRLSALLLALLLGGSLTVSAADGTEAVYVLSQEGNDLSMAQEDGELTFWEAPDVVTGQNRLGGTITLKNESSRSVDFVLSSVSLPYGDETALTYLDAVSVDVSEGDTTYYHGTFTRIMDGDRPEIRVADVPPGEQRQLTVSVSCAYTYTGQVPSYSSLVWTFTPQVKGESVPGGTTDSSQAEWEINWLLIAEVAVALVLIIALVLLCRALIRLLKQNKRKKRKKRRK